MNEQTQARFFSFFFFINTIHAARAKGVVLA